MSSAQTKLENKQTAAYGDLLAECLEHALALDKATRAAYFEELGRRDAALRDDVMSLVDAHERSGTFLAKLIGGPQLLKQFAPTGGLPDYQPGRSRRGFQDSKKPGAGGGASPMCIWRSSFPWAAWSLQSVAKHRQGGAPNGAF